MNFAAKFDDYLNPIFVKEMRRLTRSIGFYTFFILFFMLSAAVTFYALLHPDKLSAIDLSRYIFSIMGIYCFFVIPLGLEDTIKKNILSDTNELVSISTMPYSDVANGYFLFGLIQVTAIFAASLPFAFIPIFIGTIGIQKILALISISYFPCLMIIICIVRNTLKYKKKSLSGIFTDLLSSIGMWAVAIPLILTFRYALNGKFLNSFPDAVLLALLEIGLGIILYKINISTNSEKSENPKTILTFRVYMTIIWAAAIFLNIMFHSQSELFFAVIILFLLGCSISIHLEPEGYSEKFIEEMPSNPFAKLFRFPFQKGVANGFCWLIIVTVITCIFFNILIEIFTLKPFIVRKPSLLLFASIATVNAYLFFGNLIRKLFFKKYKKGSGAVIALVLFLCIGCFASHIFSREDRIQLGPNTYLTKYEGPFAPQIYPMPIVFLNPIAVALFAKDSTTSAIVLSSLLLGLGVLLNAGFLHKQITDYFTETPYEDEETDSDNDI